MRNKAKLTPLTIFVLLIAVLTLTASCGMVHSGARQLATDMARELKVQVCRVAFRPGDPCGDRNVQSEADLGTAVYVYIYGVNDQREMESLVDMATRLRDKKDRRIPVYLTFYGDLTKAHEIKTVKIKGD